MAKHIHVHVGGKAKAKDTSAAASSCSQLVSKIKREAAALRSKVEDDYHVGEELMSDADTIIGLCNSLKMSAKKLG